jgi:hypothetical protein
VPKALGGLVRLLLCIISIVLTGCVTQTLNPAPMRIDTLGKYAFAIQEKIMMSWKQPEVSTDRLKCEAIVKQSETGVVDFLSIGECNGSEKEVQSIREAILEASPLPIPDNPQLFDENIRFLFCPSCK